MTQIDSFSKRIALWPSFLLAILLLVQPLGAQGPSGDGTTQEDAIEGQDEEASDTRAHSNGPGRSDRRDPGRRLRFPDGTVTLRASGGGGFEDSIGETEENGFSSAFVVPSSYSMLESSRWGVGVRAELGAYFDDGTRGLRMFVAADYEYLPQRERRVDYILRDARWQSHVHLLQPEAGLEFLVLNERVGIAAGVGLLTAIREHRAIQPTALTFRRKVASGLLLRWAVTLYFPLRFAGRLGFGPELRLVPWASPNSNLMGRFALRLVYDWGRR